MIEANFNNFIGVFDNAMDLNVCNNIIQHFDRVQQSQYTQNRQNINSDINKLQKDTENYFLSGTSAMKDIEGLDEITINNDLYIFDQFKQSIWNCYSLYVEQYGVLNSLAKHTIGGSVKIQKTLPTQGYHMWHCEHDTIKFGNRLVLALLYLNDVKEGGETEFLYQSLRVKPKKGTLILCPAGFTHTHRGNPPLTGEKYIINTWIEFIE